MEQRLSQDQVDRLAGDLIQRPDLAAYVSPEVACASILDLRDARAEIKRLKELSASQAECMDKMDRGVM